MLDLAAIVSNFGFGVSTAGGFEFPVYVYTPDGFMTDIMQPNVWFNAVKSPLFMPEYIHEIIPTRVAHNVFIGANGNQEKEDLVTGILRGTLDPKSFASDYSIVFERRISSTIKLSNVTGGLLPNIDLHEAHETSYLVQDPFGLFGGFLEPGFYAGYTGNISVPWVGAATK